ncbi:hypothetical protein UFOVP1290_567 [uncultured Caudovirales phage]|uniref:Uncharacterized protein n=1 Tax=uncultured Caudovirales phage TaxID=2100421 RepID=A0A6J5RRY6_9CAUD|nr:hypothetical protein UFOVP1290_567 [uncultured Caudovirales phage]
MPFEDDDNDLPEQTTKINLKNISSQKLSRAQSQENLDKRVNKIIENNSAYKIKATELATQFNTAIADKTLKQNKNIFAKEMERELLIKMIQLAIDINNDPDEQEGMGSLSWITLLLKTCLLQRDRINQLEYILSQFDKKINLEIPELIKKEIKAALDKSKNGE